MRITINISKNKNVNLIAATLLKFIFFMGVGVVTFYLVVTLMTWINTILK